MNYVSIKSCSSNRPSNYVKQIKVWLPYIQADTGADVSTQFLANGLRERGYVVIDQPFNRYYEFLPWLLKLKKAPSACNAIITNTWNGFAFARKGIPMATVDRLFVLDSTLSPYKSLLQKLYHQILIRYFVIQSAKAADRVVAVSEYTADQFSKALSLPRPDVILNAVDTDFFHPPASNRVIEHSKPRRLLYVGKLSRRKGMDMLAPLMRILGEEYHLYFTGDAEDLALSGNIPLNMHAMGRLDLEQVRTAYQEAHLLIFPSRGEGLARAIMEALACGTPVVASRISSMPEAVDETVGRLCPPDNIQAFAEAVIELTDDPITWKTYSCNARKRSEDRFSLNRLLDQFEHLLSLMEV